MIGIAQGSVSLDFDIREQQQRGVLEDVADRLGYALLSWAERRRAVGPRTIDLRRVPRGGGLGRPFC